MHMQVSMYMWAHVYVLIVSGLNGSTVRASGARKELGLTTSATAARLRSSLDLNQSPVAHAAGYCVMCTIQFMQCVRSDN